MQEHETIQDYLTAATDPARHGGYQATAFWPVACSCGGERFRLVRAGSMTERTCMTCGQVRYISRFGDGLGWHEVIQDGGSEPFTCSSECDGSQGAKVCLGFAGYPELDAIKWFYVGVECCHCGARSCFNDGKVGRGPMAEPVYREIAGEPQPRDEPGSSISVGVSGSRNGDTEESAHPPTSSGWPFLRLAFYECVGCKQRWRRGHLRLFETPIGPEFLCPSCGAVARGRLTFLGWVATLIGAVLLGLAVYYGWRR